MHGVGRADRLGRDLRQAIAADVALAHEVAHGADGLGQRHVRVQPVQVVEVDVVGLQAAEAVLQRLAQGGRAAIDQALAVLVEPQAALGSQVERAVAVLQHLADQGLVGAEAIERGGVEVGVARVERALEHRLGGRPIGAIAIGVGQAHAAEADLGDLSGAELSRLHELGS